MNKDTFHTMEAQKRVIEINKLLQQYDFKQLPELIGVPSSSFSKIMREGDYFYHQSDRCYYPFVRSEEERANISLDSSDSFITDNKDTLKKIISLYERNRLMLLDERIYSKEASFTNKSIKMNKQIYEEFIHFCSDHYPHLKIQDLIAQALIDFMNSYTLKRKP